MRPHSPARFVCMAALLWPLVAALSALTLPQTGSRGSSGSIGQARRPTGFVLGVVLDATTNRPIDGATVAISPVASSSDARVSAVQRVSLALPADRAVDFFWFPKQSLAISPDGTQVAYVSANPGAPPERSTQLRVRSLASLTIRDLPGTFLAHQPFFSPDGQSVAFFTRNGELKKIALSGGNPVTLVEKINSSRFTFGVWVASGTIVFGGPGTGLKQVPADGGSPTALTSVDVAQGEIAHYPGAYAPEAGAVVFTTAFSQLRDTRLEAVILQSGERRVITENARAPRYLSTGHLMFRRGDAVLVAPIDVKRLVLAGPAAALSDDVRRDGANSEGSTPQAAVSSNGTLAYVRRADATARVMGRVGRAGAFTPFGLAAGPIRRPRVSPDGQRVAFQSPRSGSDSAFETAVHVHDLVRGTVTRLTERPGPSRSPSGGQMARPLPSTRDARMCQASTSRTSVDRSTSSFGTMMLGPTLCLNHFRPTARCSPSRATRAVSNVSGC